MLGFVLKNDKKQDHMRMANARGNSYIKLRTEVLVGNFEKNP